MMRKEIYTMTYYILYETYHNPVCYIVFPPSLVPGFAQCNLAHLQMEEDWYRFLSVSELLLRMLHCILPS